MTRIGFYTGKVYDDSVDITMINECCRVLNGDELNYDQEQLVILKKELLLNCNGCCGCEESQKSSI